MAACDPGALLEAGKCFSCLTEKQLDVAIVALLRNWLGSESTPGELLESGKCFGCLSTQQLEVVQVQLLCNING